MSYYEYLNEQSEMCREKAESVGDEKMSIFFENAAQGFKSRAGRLTIKEACGSKEEFEEEEKRRQEEGGTGLFPWFQGNDKTESQKGVEEVRI